LPRILIIAGQGQSLNGIHSGLVQKGFSCSTASQDRDILEQLGEQAPDLIMLEIKDKAGSGVAQLLHKIKGDRQLPVIALMGRQVIGHPDITLEAIDDFVIAPGDIGEIALRIERLLDRTDSAESGEVIRCGDLTIDLAKYEVYIGRRRIELTFKEYELLRFLAGNPGRVYTRDALLNKVWGLDYFGGDRTVDVHVRRLRSKLEGLGSTYIETVRNIGYRFNCDSRACILI
jgi:DNA-binding response OmpR family regulator